ncbi:lipopolysaccharide biosynthesis protein [Magnetospirillum fulvum]|uniref:O-antigen and teichoic acid export protein n=1 Tax=Magnetospirillum fulvum MGU-K5 TaxID=1316936 RepID=S9TEA6_MAGFU|nr:oligosaccharide flippase family protein [Magnetospirillum fulvum]EPY00551.1 O-antigen and teichoic acid export protein [Magnetospirillum fulvum MGU-K5]
MLRLYAKVAGLRTLSMVLAAAFIALLPTMVTPLEYGRFNLALSLTQVGAALLLSWPNQALLRFGREAYVTQGSLGEAAASRLILHLVLLVPALILAASLAGPLAAWTELDPDLLRTLLLLGLPLISLSDIATFLGQASGRYAGFGWAPLAQRACQLAALPVIALGLASGWAVLMAATLIGYGVGMALVWHSLPREALRGFRPSQAAIRQLLVYSRLLPLASVSAFLLSWMDLWFLRSLMGSEAVGIYAWAYTITLMAMTLLVPLSAMLAPRAIDHRLEQDRDSGRRLMESVGAVCALAAAALALAIGFLPALSSLVPLGSYAGAVTPVMLLAAGTVFQLGMATVEPSIYANETLASRMAAITLAMVAVNAAADAVLIPLIGLSGPALGTAAAYGTGMVLVWTLLAKSSGGGPSPWPFVALALATLALAGLAASVPPLFAALSGAVGAIILLLVSRRMGLLIGLRPLVSSLPPAAGRAIDWLAR